MNEAVKAKWLESLKAGNFQYGGSSLKAQGLDGTHFFDALGVLCHVYSCEVGGEFEAMPRKALDGPNSFFELMFGFLVPGETSEDMDFDRYYYLPDEVADWSGVVKEMQDSLGVLMTDQNAPLEEVIRYIEEKF